MSTRALAAMSLAAIVVALSAGGCGSQPSSVDATASKLSGVALSDAPASTVALRDSSTPSQDRQSTVDATGAYSFDVSGLTAPFVLKATSDSGMTQYAVALRPGTTNITEFSTATVAATYQTDTADDAWTSGSPQLTANVERIISQLQTVLAPLFQHYEITFTGDWDDSAAFRKLLSEVRFKVSKGVLTVTNRATGAVIYTSPIKSLTSGTVDAGNIPGGTTTPTPAACTYTYSTWSACDPASSTQTRTVLSSSPSGCTGTPALSQTCTSTPAPATCTSFTYDVWGACQADGTQTRTVLSSSPSGCTGGTPLVSRTCTYTPPVTACTGFTYSTWSACDPASSTQTRTVLSSSPSGCSGGSPVLTQSCTYTAPTCTSFTYSPWGTCQSNNTQTRTVTSSSPSGCTGGSPALTQSCTYTPPACTSFTYSPWGTCQSNNTQTRTVTSSSPTGCTGGSPALTQSCTYTPPACTYTYSAWGACQPDGTQTRTVTASSPSGCAGTPVLSQSCTYTAPCTLATATPTCTTCHGGSAKYPSSHTGRPLTCAACHGPVNNGSGTPSVGMTAAPSGSSCVLSYPTNAGTHGNNTVNFGGAQ